MSYVIVKEFDPYEGIVDFKIECAFGVASVPPQFHSELDAMEVSEAFDKWATDRVEEIKRAWLDVE